MKKKYLLNLIFLALVFSTLTSGVMAWETTLFSENNLDVTEHQTQFWGSFEVDAGTTLRVEWSADREVTIAILNEVDYQEDHSWTIIFRQAESIGQSGSLEFPVKNSDKFYVAVQPPITIDARLYTISAKVMSGSTDSFLQNIPIEILFGVIIASVVIIVVLITIILRKRKKKISQKI